MRVSEHLRGIRRVVRRGSKTPLLLAAAALLVAGPAPALDRARPVPAPTMEPCPSKGPGFFRVPGSGNCTRLSGRISAGASAVTGHSGTAVAPVGIGHLAIDNRTDSDLGEVRTYLRLGNGRR